MNDELHVARKPLPLSDEAFDGGAHGRPSERTPLAKCKGSKGASLFEVRFHVAAAAVWCKHSRRFWS